jgi:hypothetical protein
MMPMYLHPFHDLCATCYDLCSVRDSISMGNFNKKLISNDGVEVGTLGNNANLVSAIILIAMYV